MQNTSRLPQSFQYMVALLMGHSLLDCVDGLPLWWVPLLVSLITSNVAPSTSPTELSWHMTNSIKSFVIAWLQASSASCLTGQERDCRMHLHPPCLCQFRGTPANAANSRYLFILRGNLYVPEKVVSGTCR